MNGVELRVVEAAVVDGPACAGSDPDRWFSDDLADWQTCRAVCAGCPVWEACLAGALARGERFGVWGGVVFPVTAAACTRPPALLVVPSCAA